MESTEIGDGQLSVHILPAVSVPHNVLAADRHSLTSQRRHAIKTPITADLKTIVISRPTTTRDNHNTRPGHHHRPDSPPRHATNTTTSHLAPLHEILYTRSAHHTHSHHEILFHSPSAFHTTPSLFLLLFLPFFFSFPPPLPLFVLSTWKPQKRWSEANPFMPLPHFFPPSLPLRIHGGKRSRSLLNSRYVFKTCHSDPVFALMRIGEILVQNNLYFMTEENADYCCYIKVNTREGNICRTAFQTPPLSLPGKVINMRNHDGNAKEWCGRGKEITLKGTEV